VKTGPLMGRDQRDGEQTAAGRRHALSRATRSGSALDALRRRARSVVLMDLEVGRTLALLSIDLDIWSHTVTNLVPWILNGKPTS